MPITVFLLDDHEIVRRGTAGLTNRQIGAELFLAERTVENHVSSLLHELGSSRRTEAAVHAAEHRRAQHGRA